MFHMQRQRRLPEEHARFYSAEISLALNFLHEKGNFEYRFIRFTKMCPDEKNDFLESSEKYSKIPSFESVAKNIISQIYVEMMA